MTELIVDRTAQTSTPVHPLLAARWSPRWLDPAGEVAESALRAMLEAARWAPSAGNTQPARFFVGRRGDDTYQRLFDLLKPGNQAWAKAAGALLLGVAVTHNEKGEVPYATYGVGLASENLVLQAVAEGLVAHQMAGFDRDAARRVFALPEHATPLVVIAVGVLGDPELIPDELREREFGPRRRRPLAEIAFKGTWGEAAF
jgi:nitroreductase